MKEFFYKFWDKNLKSIIEGIFGEIPVKTLLMDFTNNSSGISGRNLCGISEEILEDKYF